MNLITPFLVVACILAAAVVGYLVDPYRALASLAAGALIAALLKMVNVWQKFCYAWASSRASRASKASKARGSETRIMIPNNGNQPQPAYQLFRYIVPISSSFDRFVPGPENMRRYRHGATDFGRGSTVNARGADVGSIAHRAHGSVRLRVPSQGQRVRAAPR